jgi:hypothetical protein
MASVSTPRAGCKQSGDAAAVVDGDREPLSILGHEIEEEKMVAQPVEPVLVRFDVLTGQGAQLLHFLA